MNTLPLDCPFCGSLEVEVCRTNPDACWIRCAECGGETKSHPTRAGALANWNRRDSLKLTASIVSDDEREWIGAGR